jgi:hypothetical protein
MHTVYLTIPVLAMAFGAVAAPADVKSPPKQVGDPYHFSLTPKKPGDKHQVHVPNPLGDVDHLQNVLPAAGTPHPAAVTGTQFYDVRPYFLCASMHWQQCHKITSPGHLTPDLDRFAEEMKATELLLGQCSDMGPACDSTEVMGLKDTRMWRALLACTERPETCSRIATGCEGSSMDCLVRLEYELIQKPDFEKPAIAKRSMEVEDTVDAIDMAVNEPETETETETDPGLTERTEEEFKRADDEWRKHAQSAPDVKSKQLRKEELAKEEAPAFYQTSDDFRQHLDRLARLRALEHKEADEAEAKKANDDWKEHLYQQEVLKKQEKKGNRPVHLVAAEKRSLDPHVPKQDPETVRRLAHKAEKAAKKSREEWAIYRNTVRAEEVKADLQQSDSWDKAVETIEAESHDIKEAEDESYFYTELLGPFGQKWFHREEHTPTLVGW